MLKNILIASLSLTLVLCTKEEFPSFDIFHANCVVQVTYPSQSCQQTHINLERTIRSFNPEPDAKGIYAVKESLPQDYIWATRTTPVQRYVDDIIFEVEQKGEDCVVKAKSRSQTFSIYDFETNYCNIYNVHRYIGGFQDIKTEQCRFKPTDPDSRCKIY
eukprot:403368346